MTRAGMLAVSDLLFAPLDFSFEFVADFQLIFDEIVEPVTDRLLFFERKSVESRLDFFNGTHRA